MKIQKNNICFLLLLMTVGFMWDAVSAADQDNPHNLIIGTNINCISCHLSMPEIKADLNTKNNKVDLAEFKQDGIKMCTTCHDEEEGHVVGVSLDFSVPADLPLGTEKSIQCLTCHYTHGELLSTRPQASFSFMDRLLNSDRLHKSFLIRRSNISGELCLTCHTIE